ncbi:MULTISPECIES: DUF3426 domain-containing protein [unclassified Burkholderia]|uniref:DUF3426 domain-containing protein n=1 Tax=unclassified Burkholderia TaxID=2613784 RepID=UPI0007523447|nr:MULTISPECIES: DUF3426 domain-containing protein [unclassified Burkholderia]KUY91423.1 hypothetical protein WS49_03055 [Burkholderia sp. RF7-non_BP4]KUY97237.1 hypothetical protein WS48_14130 [Burkholderia sp. RF7-non_BP1]
MLLATRCPHCETVFRLQQEQLSLHDGLVRCGHCHQVFNASQSLVPEPALTEAAPAGPAAAVPQHEAAPARLFATDAPVEPTSGSDYQPEGWDMWAPWLDAGVDPSLQHTVQTVRTEPLVPLALPAMDAGVVHLSGTPAPISSAPAELHAVASAEPDWARHETDSSGASRATPPAEPDLREPRFVAHTPPAADADEPVGNAHFSVPDDERAPREPRFAFTPAQAVPEPGADADERAPAPAAAASEAAVQPAAPFPAALADDDRPHFAVTRETRAPQRRGMLGGFFGGLVAAALAVLLVAQLAWWQRETVMIDWPVTQGWFRQACAPLGCTVTPPRAIDGLRLDAADLRQLDGPRVLELKVPLTNRYRVALAYPSLELTLLDDTNHVTVRRVLAPRDYVRPGTPIDAGLPPGTTRTMVVRLDTNGAPASNFRVQIFYP